LSEITPQKQCKPAWHMVTGQLANKPSRISQVTD